MRILHTADWHIGKKLGTYSRIPEQVNFLEELTEICDKEQVDIIVVSGDLFDNFNPSTESIEILYKYMKKLGNGGMRPVIAIAGNHDSADRIEAPNPLARECGIIFCGYPDTEVRPLNLKNFSIKNSDKGFIELNLKTYPYPLRAITTAFANETRLKAYLEPGNEEELRTALQRKWEDLVQKYCDDQGVNILMAHLFLVPKGDPMPEEPDDEKPILHIGGTQAIFTENLPKKGIQYVALGHLHRKQQIKYGNCPVYYSGSPVSYSFSEANQDKYLVIVDLEPGKAAKVKEIRLKSGKALLRKKAAGVDEAVGWLLENQDSLVELTVVSEEYLTANDRRRINDAHSGVINIIPNIKTTGEKDREKEKIDLSKSRKELFKDYFKNKTGQDANTEIMELFKEITSTEQ